MKSREEAERIAANAWDFAETPNDLADVIADVLGARDAEIERLRENCRDEAQCQREIALRSADEPFYHVYSRLGLIELIRGHRAERDALKTQLVEAVGLLRQHIAPVAYIAKAREAFLARPEIVALGQ